MDAKRNASDNSGLMIGGIHDPMEKAVEQMADRVMRMPTPEAAVHRKCAGCEGEEKKVQRAPQEQGEEEETVQTKSVPNSTPIAPGSRAVAASPGASNAIRSMGTGKPLSRAERGFFEPRFCTDLSSVRIHDGPAANKASQGIHARAFTHGNDIAFANGERQPGTEKNRHLMAHELAHVVGEGKTSLRKVRRDLGVEPPNPEATAGNLTEQENTAAQRYNERRFEDPFTISIVRDVLGIDKYPAVIDQAFTDATLRWQIRSDLNQAIGACLTSRGEPSPGKVGKKRQFRPCS